MESPSARNEVLQFASEVAREVETGRYRSLKVYGDCNLVNDLLYDNLDLGEMYYVPQVNSGDFVMDVVKLAEVSKSAARALERAARQGLHVSENRSKLVSSHHISIMRDFVEQHGIAPIDRIFFSAVPLWIARSDVRVFEVFNAGELISFFIVHEWSARLAFFLASFSRPNARNVGDATLGYLHGHYVRTGGRVYLGPAVDDQSAAFKRKWGRDVGNAPTSGAVFSRKNGADLADHLNVWWARAAYGCLAHP